MRALVVVVVMLMAAAARGAIPGGGSPATDCHAEFSAPGLQLNHPPFDPAKPRARKEVRCFDGDAGCDADGVVNQECRFAVDVCLHNTDPALPACVPAAVSAVKVGKATKDADLAALQAALDALVPATTTACTVGQGLRVPLKAKGTTFGAAKKNLRVKAVTASGADSDRLALTCLPRGWPSHGYDHANRRAAAEETAISSATAAFLVPKWTLDLGTVEGAGGNHGVSSTPTVGDGLVFVTSWNGKLYAVSAKKGTIKWSYDTLTASELGLQSSATLTADGRVLVGDSRGTVHCLLAKNGKLLWTATVGDTDPDHSHIWASPVVANGRVFVGRASHNDTPCTQGHLYAFDLDTGAELWRYATVPAKVCNTDTTIACSTDVECGAGTCVPGVGGGVTASVAVAPDGETVYMASVGCFTAPSIGDSESIFALDAATGVAHWVYRTQAVEQFSDGPPYHDYGFLNGPLLIDADDGLGGTRPLVVAASKDGSIYSADPATGAPVWTRALTPAPDFAGFGLFNAAIGWADNRLYASLFEYAMPGWPTSNDHLYAFDDLAGATVWSDQIGASWGSVAIANGVLFVGTNAAPELYAYAAETGTRLATFGLPNVVTSGGSIVDGSLYVGYGFVAAGGVAAFTLP